MTNYIKHTEATIGIGTNTSVWIKDESLHCVNCGEKGVWFERAEGDYYVGPQHFCTKCNSGFTLQGPYAIIGDDFRGVIIMELRAFENKGDNL